MSIVTINVLTVISSLVLLGTIESYITHELTLSEYCGIWYQIALYVPHKEKIGSIDAEWFNVSQSDICPNCFEELYGNSVYGETLGRKKGFGIIAKNNIMRVSYPTLRKQFWYKVEIFAHGNELILHGSDNIQITKLLSRNRTVSAATRTRFEEIAISNDFYAVYADPEGYPSPSD